uniref:Fibronectin type-III domain-containing protein n=1 Tax=Oryzias latipes TaxID=8090 RepID=A0A3P9L382_ORYLA
IVLSLNNFFALVIFYLLCLLWMKGDSLWMSITWNILSHISTVPGTSQITFSRATNSSSLQFEWSPVIGTDRYILVVEELNSDPLKSSNWTFTSLSGQVSGLSPATRYASYIYAENSAGRGAKMVQPPLGLIVTTKTASSVQVQWNPVDKVLQYLVTVRDANNPNSPAIKNVSSTSTEFTSLKPCSTFTVEVSSYNIFLVPGESTSSQKTDPCVPSNVEVSKTCSPDSATVNWLASNGAIFYYATAQDANGNPHECFSLGTSCSISGLKCGQNYTASVSGNNFYCNSTQSQEVAFTTGPCAPANVAAFAECDTNHAVVNWQNNQNYGHYTAMIEDGSGAKLTCTSDRLNCSISPLPCGKKLNVTVTYTDGNCSSTSTPVSMDSGTAIPCAPEDVKVSVNCSTEELTITWSSSSPAEEYSAIISGGTGQPLYCNSTDSHCTLRGLRCGSRYNVTVSSFNGSCLSPPSSEVTALTSPCPPTNVSAVHTCAPDPVPVSWAATGINAKQYTAVAVSHRGHKSECTTNQTSCSLSGLQCGETYYIHVSGANDNCFSQDSSPVSLHTEPCPPSNATSQLINGTAHVTWSPGANAAGYNVKATSHSHSITCSSFTSNCTLSDLVCGQDYDIRVSATDGTCASNYSAPFVQNQALITWVGRPNALGYNVTAKGLGGDIHSCHTNTSSCEVTDIKCGETYSVEVTAYTQTCTGSQSLPHRFRAGGGKFKFFLVFEVTYIFSQI